MAYQINIWRMDNVGLDNKKVGWSTYRLSFEDDEDTYVEVPVDCPSTAMEVIERMFKVYGDDDQKAGITNTLDEIKEHRYDIMVAGEAVPFGEFEHLYEKED